MMLTQGAGVKCESPDHHAECAFADLAAPENYPDITPIPGADPTNIQPELLTRAIQTWLLRPLVPPAAPPRPNADDVTRTVETQPSAPREPVVP
jgi:hypothetical protein